MKNLEKSVEKSWGATTLTDADLSFARLLTRSLVAAAGLVTFAVGIYMTLQANIGVAPWDCFYLGIQETFGVQYGNISIGISVIIIIINLLMKERIGIGTLLDAMIVGKSVDLCSYLELIPQQESIGCGIALMLAGLFVNGLGQYIYMRMGLCCGPRDGLMVGLSKRMPKVPIGMVSNMLLALTLFFGWCLGGPIGVGTIVAAFCMGPAMQLVFHMLRFDAAEVKHQDLFETFQMLLGKQKRRL